MGQSEQITKVAVFPARVAQVLNEYRVVINKGANHGLKIGQRLLLYALSADEIRDPETGESLGRLENVKGTGKVIHVQESMSIVESDKLGLPEKIVRRPMLFGLRDTETVENPVRLPFEDPAVSDMMKPV